MRSDHNVIIDQPVIDSYLLTGNGYVNVSMYWPEDNNKTRTFWPTDLFITKVLRFSAATQNIKFKVLGSLDSSLTFTETAIPETTLVVGVPYTIELSKYYTALKIQVAPAALNVFGTFSATLTGSNLPSSTITADLDVADIEVLQGQANQSLASIDTKLPALVGGKIPIDAGGLATAANQAAANQSLAAIATRYAQNLNLKIDFASVAEQTIIAAPAAGYRIVIQSIFMTCLVNNIVVMKSGSTEIGKAYVYGFSKDYISGLILGTAEAFKITAATADPIYGQICYYMGAVP